MSNRRSMTRTTVPSLALIALQLLNLNALSLGAPSVQARDAVVLVFSRSLRGSGLGNGFAIGDGSLIVTAHHIVFSDSSAGGHLMLDPVTILSPYLGEAVHGEVIAADEDLDLAVLKVPWKGHPSLELASDHEIIKTESLKTIRLAYAEEAGFAAPNQSLNASGPFESDTIPVDIVGVRDRVPRFVQLVRAGRLKRGWSGAPMILPDSAKVAACFTNLSMTTAEGLKAKSPKPSQKSRARGPALSQLKRLLGAHGYASVQARTPIPSTEHAPDLNAMQAFQAACKASALQRPGLYAQVLEPAQAFIELRPGSPMGYEYMAFALERMDRKDEAKVFYEQALKHEPVSAALQLYYSQFLSEMGQADRAMGILEGLKNRGVLEDCVCIGMVNILGEQGRLERCIQLLDERLTRNPRNAYLWQQKAGCLAQTQGLGIKVAECFEKAVALRPEIGPLRGNLAHLLKQIGELERAEFHYRELLDIEPDNPVVYVWLARFLVEHRPTAKPEALKYAEKALRLPANPRGPSQQKIQDLVSSLESQ
jgi:tetratricopeptide (TPR) repeat protein